MTQVPETIDSSQASDALAQAEQLAGTGATVDDTLAQAEQTVDDALATVDDALAQAEQTVDHAQGDTAAIVDDALAQAEQTVHDARAGTDATGDDALARTDQPANDALVQADRPVEDTHAETALPTTAPGGSAATSGGSPPPTRAEAIPAPHEAGDVSLLGAPGSESAAPEGSSPSSLPADSGGGLLGDLPHWSRPFAEPAAAGPPALDPVAAAPPPAPGAGAGLDGIVTTATDPRVMTAAGVTVLVGGGLSVWRGGAPLADASVMFTNFRLLPCLIKGSVADHVGAVAAALGRRGPDAAAQIAVPPAMAPPRGAAAEASTMSAPFVEETVKSGTLTRFASSVHEGFEQGVLGNRGIADTAEDSRVLIQLGMGLGSVYAVFLTVWFWATRLRRHSSAS